MKLIKTHLFVLAASACASVMLCACSGSNVVGLSGQDSRLLGRWLVSSIETTNPSGGPLDCQPEGASIEIGEGQSLSCGPSDTYLFENNGAVVLSDGSEVDNGTWSTNDNGSITITANGASSTGSYFVTGNTLEITLVNGGTTGTITLERLLD